MNLTEILNQFSYIFPITAALIFIVLIFIIPDWKEDKSKKALLYFLSVWLFWLFVLIGFEIIFSVYPYPINDFYYYLSGLTSFPLFYNYISVITRNKSLSNKKWLFFYVPTAVLFIAYHVIIATYGFLPYVFNLSDFYQQLPAPEIFIRILTGIAYVFYSIFIVFSGFKLMSEYQRDIENDFSCSSNIKLSWVYVILVLFSLFSLIAVICFSFNYDSLNLIGNLADTLLMAAIVFFGLKHKNVYSDQFEPYSSLVESVEKESIVTINEHNKVLSDRLRTCLHEDKVWKNSELTAEDMVRILGTNRTYFSRFLKEAYGCNFRSFINQIRVDAAKELLASSPEISIAEISFMTGFSSSSCFNSWFSKFTQVSPSEYRNSQKK